MTGLYDPFFPPVPQQWTNSVQPQAPAPKADDVRPTASSATPSNVIEFCRGADLRGGK